MGKWLIVIGIVCIAIGLILTYADKFPLGKLPGDISVERGNFKFYFPLTTCILISLLLSLILFLYNRFKS